MSPLSRHHQMARASSVKAVGQTIDVLVCEKWELAATRRYFTRALQSGPCQTSLSVWLLSADLSGRV
jgi:hypothetical protein